MKVQIIGSIVTPSTAVVEVKYDGHCARLPLPTHEVLTEESLKQAIATGLAALKTMKDKMALVETLRYQDIDIED